MFKILALLILLNPTSIGSFPEKSAIVCTCPSVSNLQKTGQTSNSITYSWNSVYKDELYKVWYIRQEDGYNSGFVYTSYTSHTFSGLSAGYYTFYFQTLCGEESSGYVGIEDSVML